VKKFAKQKTAQCLSVPKRVFSEFHESGTKDPYVQFAHWHSIIHKAQKKNVEQNNTPRKKAKQDVVASDPEWSMENGLQTQKCQMSQKEESSQASRSPRTKTTPKKDKVQVVAPIPTMRLTLTREPTVNNTNDVQPHSRKSKSQNASLCSD
jgi:hypothetical protein